jgi:hypothetical protein
MDLVLRQVQLALDLFNRLCRDIPECRLTSLKIGMSASRVAPCSSAA